ncbi:MAG: GNAT family N-acetyltransferase [Candidatus Aenigmarchaeota archaeon]|nr:GNAT family N-acetyltransferase [Candidatus Aenigmarchaeota archaeon]
MELNVRKATPQDLEMIKELNSMLAEHMQDFEGQVNSKWSFGKDGDRYFRQRLSNINEGCIFLATMGGKVVGYLAGGFADKKSRANKTAELENMFVLEGFRKNGVGTKLAEEFLNWCKKQRTRTVKVSTAAGNSKTLKFYRSVGFLDQAITLELKL